MKNVPINTQHTININGQSSSSSKMLIILNFDNNGGRPLTTIETFPFSLIQSLITLYPVKRKKHQKSLCNY